MGRRRWLAVALSLIGFIGLIGGCAKRERRGPLFAVLIIDTSASVSGLHDDMLEYARLTLDHYSKLGPMKLTIIKLDEDPTAELQKEGYLYEDDIADVLKYVKNITYDAKGTDIIGAFDLAERYYGYEKIRPRAFKILCFTDGFIDAPKGQHYRKWGQFDWAKMGEQGASIGLYFVDPKVRDEIERALAPVNNYFVKNKNDALDDLKNQNPKFP